MWINRRQFPLIDSINEVFAKLDKTLGSYYLSSHFLWLQIPMDSVFKLLYQFYEFRTKQSFIQFA